MEKSVVIGMKDRVVAKAVLDTRRKTVQPFALENTHGDAVAHTDGATSNIGLDLLHKTVCQSVREYVRLMVHVNGMESFLALLKPRHTGFPTAGHFGKC